jgi:ATP-dependent helicase HrpB
LLRAAELGEASARRAAVLVALLEERDILRGDGRAPPVDLRLRVDAIERDLDHAMLAGATLDRGAVARVAESAREWQRRLAGLADGPGMVVEVGALLAIGWPERIARRRDAAGRFATVGGRGVRLHADDPLANAPWLVVADLDDSGPEARALLAAPLDDDDVAVILRRDAVTRDMVRWDDAERAVVATRRTMLGALLVDERAISHADVDAVRETLIDGIRQAGIASLPWDPEAGQLRERLACLHHHDASWPDVSDSALLASLDAWLGPFLLRKRRLDQVQSRDLTDGLLSVLEWSRRRELDVLAPERITVPSGSRIAIDYADAAAPVLAVRLQEVFGLAETPRILQGRVPLVMHLLSPARRPMQVTTDLASFWKTGYFDVRKDLRGRYPKHHWPEDPAQAEAVRGAKRRDDRR